jgi:hypothetical protein
MLTLHTCPTCGAKTNEPCRTPKGRKKDVPHDTRPFSIDSLGGATTNEKTNLLQM